MFPSFPSSSPHGSIPPTDFGFEGPAERNATSIKAQLVKRGRKKSRETNFYAITVWCACLRPPLLNPGRTPPWRRRWLFEATRDTCGGRLQDPRVAKICLFDGTEPRVRPSNHAPTYTRVIHCFCSFCSFCGKMTPVFSHRSCDHARGRP